MFTDDYSRFTNVYLIRIRDKAFDTFKEYKSIIKN